MITKKKLKSFKFTTSGRSSDYIAPSFGNGCLLNCTYCYMKRYNPEGLKVNTNVEDVLTAINNHAMFDTIEKPNQTDLEFITYDIACNEDFALHRKYHPWERIFDFFKNHPRAKATLATKIIPEEFLKYNPEGKVRIRFSLMPQMLSSILEPNTPYIMDRIIAINRFIEAGYDVHVNFSPVVVFQKWKEYYGNLFSILDKYVKTEHKDKIKAEVIFLTHNEHKHYYNLENNLLGEHFLWAPEFQEPKFSENNQKNIRYKASLKKRYIDEFVELHDSIIPWNTIRYIF